MGIIGAQARVRVAGRLATAFVLDLAKLGGHRRDIVDAVLRAAISDANQAHLSRDPALHDRYLTLGDDAPDDLRRAASINAIAGSLRIPFETARRRIIGLAEAGVVRLTPAGVIVPRSVTSSPPYRAALQYQYARLGELYLRLRAIGALPPPPPVEAGCDARDPPVRLAGRLTTEFVLRLTDTVSAHVKDLVTCLILLEMIIANTEHLADVEGGGEAPESFVPDARRAPITAAALSQRLNIAAETVRRHVRDLEAQGICQRATGGYVVPAASLARGPFAQWAQENHANVVRLFAALGERGALCLWERPSASQAARG